MYFRKKQDFGKIDIIGREKIKTGATRGPPCTTTRRNTTTRGGPELSQAVNDKGSERPGDDFPRR